MHKRIVMLLRKMIDESPYDFCSYNIIDNPKGDGFWKMDIRIYGRDNAHTAAFIESIRHIGTVYGEGLSINEDGNLIEIA